MEENDSRVFELNDKELMSVNGGDTLPIGLCPRNHT